MKHLLTQVSGVWDGCLSKALSLTNPNVSLGAYLTEIYKDLGAQGNPRLERAFEGVVV